MANETVFVQTDALRAIRDDAMAKEDVVLEHSEYGFPS